MNRDAYGLIHFQWAKRNDLENPEDVSITFNTTCNTLKVLVDTNQV